MIKMTTSAIAKCLQAKHQGPEVTICGVSTDSRHIQPGECFIAIQGPSFDGHEFIAAAAKRGAAAAIVSRDVVTNLPTLKVTDTRLALGNLAKIWREQFTLPIVAVTGSSGKTTVKEMIANILAQSGPVLATQGNLNNDFGAPLTLLRLSSEHQYAVIELGANHPGEIAYTVALTQPSVALITNVAPAHLAGFGSIEGVARAKGEIYQGLVEQGIAVINVDDEYAEFWRSSLSRPYFTFGIHHPADFYARDVSLDALAPDALARYHFVLCTPAGSIPIQLPIPGQHNVMNGLAAAAAAFALGIPLSSIQAGLETVKPVKGRLISRQTQNGAHIIDDTYNANPGSVRAAIELLAQCKGQRILVLGDMGELGDKVEFYHRLVGEQARQSGIEHIYACGNFSRLAVETFGQNGYFFPEQDALINMLKQKLQANMTILVKGSLSARMENVVNALAEKESTNLISKSLK